MEIQIENELESYESLKALVERQKKLEEMGDSKAAKALNGLIEQFEYSAAYSVIVEE